MRLSRMDKDSYFARILDENGDELQDVVECDTEEGWMHRLLVSPSYLGDIPLIDVYGDPPIWIDRSKFVLVLRNGTKYPSLER